jgi:hypothetical protein
MKSFLDVLEMRVTFHSGDLLLTASNCDPLYFIAGVSTLDPPLSPVSTIAPNLLNPQPTLAAVPNRRPSPMPRGKLAYVYL